MKDYSKADRLLHGLCQIIAKINRSFVPKEADDSHTNFYFDPLHQRILGRWIEMEYRPLILTFNLKEFQFEWLDQRLNIIGFFKVEGRTLDEIENTIDSGLNKLGLSSSRFNRQLHYSIPDYPLLNKPLKKLTADQLDSWALYRQMGNEACYRLLGMFQINGEVRIWPHHFDTGIYFEPDQKMGLGFGLSMKDTLVGEPYLYITAYPLEGQTLDLSNPATLKFGRWINSTEWKGAVLALKSIKEQKFLNTFMCEGVAALLKSAGS